MGISKGKLPPKTFSFEQFIVTKFNMSKGEETPNRKPSLSKICLLVLNLCFIVFTPCDMPMCVHYLQQLFSSKVLFRNFFKVVSPPSLLSLSRKFFLVKYVEGSSTISVQTFPP